MGVFKRKKRDGSFDVILSFTLFICFLFWVDDQIDGSVLNACNACKLPHVDSVGDGFEDEGFAVLFRHRLKGR